jgi:uncharacterized protein
VISIGELDDRVTFDVKVHPRAHRNARTGEAAGALKLSLTALAPHGRANGACIAFLANLLKVPIPSVNIASGWPSRNKAIRVAGVTAKYAQDRAQAESRR